MLNTEIGPNILRKLIQLKSQDVLNDLISLDDYCFLFRLEVKRKGKKGPSIEDSHDEVFEDNTKAKPKKIPKPDFKNYVKLETGGKMILYC